MNWIEDVSWLSGAWKKSLKGPGKTISRRSFTNTTERMGMG